MNRIANGQGKAEDLKQLKYLGEIILKSSKCNLGQTGPKPVLDAIDHFEDQFSGAIQLQKKIPRQQYKVKVTAPCESACPSHLPMTASPTLPTACRLSAPTPPFVVIDSCNSGVPDRLLASGCSMTESIAAIAHASWNHGRFVSQTTQFATGLRKDGVIANQDRSALTRCAAWANIK